MSLAEPAPQYEKRWYATFWDERDQPLVHRVGLGPGKIAIPLEAMYMTFDVELRPGSAPAQDGEASAWMEQARAADTCCVYQCAGKNFPYCAEHDAP